MKIRFTQTEIAKLIANEACKRLNQSYNTVVCFNVDYWGGHNNSITVDVELNEPTKETTAPAGR